MLAIKNAKIVLENKIVSNGVLLVDNGKIIDFGCTQSVVIPEECETFDAKGDFVGPGFVDIHCHGGGGFSLCENPVEASKHFLKHGETTVLSTFYTTVSKQKFLENIALFKLEKRKNRIKNIYGFYMEGPYMNPKYGASPELNKWLDKISAEDYKEFVDELGNLAFVWAIAPEREGITEFLEYAKFVNPNAVIAIAHSEATPTEAAKVKKYGVTLQTHCTNATGCINRAAGVRSCGPDEICFLDDEMYAEIICDSQGIHVEPEMLKLILKIKGRDRVILISDSFVSNEPTPKEFEHITDISFDASGNLSGSKLTLDVACKNMIMHTACSICDAFAFASTNPARAIGLDNEIGSIAKNKKANLVLVDDDFNVKNVILEGEIVC